MDNNTIRIELKRFFRPYKRLNSSPGPHNLNEIINAMISVEPRIPLISSGLKVKYLFVLSMISLILLLNNDVGI